MALNIKDPVVHEMVKEIDRITGESQAQVVATAVRERLAHLEEDDVAARLLAVGRRTAARMSPEIKRLDHGTLLYDERGLPNDRRRLCTRRLEAASWRPTFVNPCCERVTTSGTPESAPPPTSRPISSAPMTHPVRYRPGDALLALYRRRGPIVDAGVGRHGYIYLFGAEANKFVFANSDAFNWWEAFQVLVPVDGPTALIVSDGADHRRRRSLVQPAFHHRHLAHYLQIMAANADAVIDTWRPGQTIDIFAQLRSAIRRSAIESLFGQRMARHADFLGEQLQPLMDLTHRLPQVLRAEQRLRSPAWRNAMAAKARVDELIYAEIARARTHPSTDDNMLSSLVDGRTEAGEALRDDEIRDQVVSLIAAGYETTSAAMGWAVHSLLSQPGVWEAAAAEVRDVLGGRVPEAADLKSLTYLNGVVHETLRLYPPAVISARKVTRDLSFAGRRVRAGRTLVFSPYVTHRLPELFADPLRFDPRRWDPASPKYRRPAPYEFLPFGGGTHRCIGSAFATAELTVMLARLLAKTRLSLPDQRIRAGGYAALRPRHGLMVQVDALH